MGCPKAVGKCLGRLALRLEWACVVRARRNHDDVAFDMFAIGERDAVARRAGDDALPNAAPAKQAVIWDQDSIEQRGVDYAANRRDVVYETVSRVDKLNFGDPCPGPLRERCQRIHRLQRLLASP